MIYALFFAVFCGGMAGGFLLALQIFLRINRVALLMLRKTHFVEGFQACEAGEPMPPDLEPMRPLASLAARKK